MRWIGTQYGTGLVARLQFSPANNSLMLEAFYGMGQARIESNQMNSFNLLDLHRCEYI